jgi:hypothetical protein
VITQYAVDITGELRQLHPALSPVLEMLSGVIEAALTPLAFEAPPRAPCTVTIAVLTAPSRLLPSELREATTQIAKELPGDCWHVSLRELSLPRKACHQ